MLSMPMIILNKCSLSGTVRPDDSHDTIRGKHEVQIIEQQFIAECFRHVLCLDHLIALSEGRSG